MGTFPISQETGNVPISTICHDPSADRPDAALPRSRSGVEMTLESKVALGLTTRRGHMGTWIKTYKPAIAAGILAIRLAANPALAESSGNPTPKAGGTKRAGAGFVSGALIGA